jgi:VCBS repeat-containing protein
MLLHQAAEGAGATEAAAYTAALNSIVEVVKTKAASSEALDLTSTADLALIKTQVKTEVASTAGVNTTAFNALADDTATAVENVNTKIDSITDTDLTSDASKSIFSTTQVLADQVKTAAAAEVSSSGTGNITFTDASVVNTAASNKAPTNITLSKNAISEAASSLVIGTLTTADSDQTTGVKFKYALAEVTGSDYAAFSINQSTGELSLKAQPDYETKSSYSVTILSTDEGGKTFSKSFTVSITDASESPTLTVPTGGSVTEDATTSTITGSLVGSDPEDDSLTYSVVGSTPSSGSYSVTGTYGTLVLNASTGAYTYTLNNSATAVQALGASSSETETFSVKVSDGTNTPAAQNLVFTIKGANDAPSSVALDSTSVVENSAGAIVGALSGSDAEGTSVSYSVASSGDGASFEIDSSNNLKLKSSVSADRETKSTYSVTVDASDGDATTSKSFTISVGDVDEAPTLTVPTGGSVTEDATTSTITGSLVGSDPEDDSLTYSVVGSTPSSGSYSVTGTYGTLVLNASTGAYTYTLNNSATAVQALGASSSETETFSVKVSDGTNTPAAQNLVFTIKGANDAPSSVALDSTSVVENSAGAIVGALSGSDAEGTSVSYSVASSGDGASFEIDSSNNLKLKSSVSADRETKSTYSVTVDASDGDATTSKSFTISVGDVDEAPTLTVPTGGSVTEDATTSTITGSLVGSDPEDDSLTYSVVGSTPSSGSYSVTGTYGTLVLNASTGAYTYTLNNSATAVQALGASSSETETFSVKVSDGTNTPAAQNLVFTIKGANDAPTITVSGLTSIAENSTNAVAATVSSSDAEDGSKTVTLSGTGRDDAKFEVVDGKLRIKTSADYETQDTYQVQLKVTDDAGVAVLKNLEFGVTDVAEAISGSVVDGYVAGATIFQDLDNDNVLDSGEAYTTTSATGAFTLTGIVASKTAPLKMISGFDIGTNQPIVTSLGVPTNITGTAVASPIATIAATNQANNSDVSLTHVVDRVATYFNISETSQANINILNDDPITKLTDSSSDVVSAAKDVFEANQFIMGLTHISEKAGKYLADQIDAAIQNAGDNSYGTYAGGSVSAYEKLGADAFLDTAGSHVMTPITPTTANAFQISSAQIEWHDYDPTLALDVTNRVVSSTSGSTVSLGSEAVKLNVQNLINAANTSGTYKSPKLSFELLNIPNGSGSGTVNFILIDGTDGTRSSGERQVYLDVDVNWTGDGETATITMPTQTLSGYYLTASDLRVDFTLSNLDDDTISITQGRSYTDGDYPATLEIRLASVIDKLESVGSISLLKEGTFNLSVSTDLPLKDSNDVTVTKLQTNLQLVDDTPLEVFVEDATYFEDDASPTTTIYLNRVHTEDITITYNVAVTGSDNATAGSDFTGQTSKTVTILAGLTSVTVALPILADSSVESAETFSVVATSASAGSLKKATGTVTIDDSDTTVSTSGELDSLAADVVSDLATDIGAALLTAYQTAASSASKSLSATSSDISTAAAAVTPGLTTVMKAFYGIVAAEITSAVSSNSAAADFAQALMTANSATKLFDPSTIIGTYINGNGTYIGSNNLSSLTAAIQSEYNTFKTYAVETVGDVFGTDTAANFAGAVVNMLTTGNDKETLTSASEIIPTFDGTDTVYAAAGNDKIIGGSGVDTFYGQDGNDHLYGYRGNDVLDGGDGNDRIVGGLGDDTISGGAGNDYVLAQEVTIQSQQAQAQMRFLGALGDDVITVDGAGNKTIDGGTGTDSLTISLVELRV